MQIVHEAVHRVFIHIQVWLINFENRKTENKIHTKIKDFQHSKEGSAPSSVHGSRVDLASFDKGSAIYLGCSPPRQNSVGGMPPIGPSTGAISKMAPGTTNSTLSLNNRSKSKSPKNTPPVSPKKMPNQSKISLKSATNKTATSTTTTTSTSR